MRYHDRMDTLNELAAVLEARKGANPEDSYVASLYAKGLNRILEKVGEEATETLLAAKDAAAAPNDPERARALTHEVADLWFHTLVMLAQLNQHPQQVLDVLAERFGVSGHAEKAARDG